MDVIGVPFDLCGYRLGSRLGPDAIRLEGLEATLTEHGLKVRDRGNIPVDLHEKTRRGGLRNFEAAHPAYQQTYNRVTAAYRSDRRPLVLGGDHSNAIGSLGAALSYFESDLAVLWVDAHADLNVPASSPSGNLHGMPLACLMGLPSGVTGLRDLQWRQLQAEFAASPLRAERTAWLGLRDVDSGERAHLRSLPTGFVSTMYDIDRRGLVHEVERFDAFLRGIDAKHLWISFDVDSLDPFLAPGTGTAVRGGLTYREMHLLGEMLCEKLAGGSTQLVGVEIVETNPLIDHLNQTAKMAVEWVGSLFGKTILGVHP